ncbi:MAG: SPOR domain-containing protein, partial [Terriglobus sp.]
LICAVFFGFGYSMGRKSTQAPVAAAAAPISDGSSDSADDTATHADSGKPAPGSPAIQSVPGYLSQQEADASNSAATKTVTATKKAAEPEPAPAPVKTVAAVAPTPATVVRTPAPVASSAPAPAGAVFVQIAAVSHQEDADVLKSALNRRGYKVVERSDANDRLIHVQIGPFSDRKAAEATRQKLLSDGYNAFLK